MKILVFQHVATEHPGSFRDVMAAQGHSMTAVELDEGEAIPDLRGFDALLVMGGPMDVWQLDEFPWLKDEISAINKWVTAGRPYLGMCLGAQLLATAMGGHVGLMDGPAEVGMSGVWVDPDPLFEDVPPLCPCFQWHGAEVKTLPPGANLLATSAGSSVQAFKVGAAAYGLQFHMELTKTSAREWGELPAYIGALERAKGPGALPKVQAQVEKNFTALYGAGTQIFSNFLTIAARTQASLNQLETI